jgi:hypothetical protein
LTIYDGEDTAIMVYYEEQLVRAQGCADVTHTNIGILIGKYIANCVRNHCNPHPKRPGHSLHFELLVRQVLTHESLQDHNFITMDLLIKSTTACRSPRHIVIISNRPLVYPLLHSLSTASQPAHFKQIK